AAELDGPEFRHPALKGLPRRGLVKARPRSKIVDPGLEEAASGIEKVQRQELAAGVCVAGWNKRVRREELSAVFRAPDVTSVMVIVGEDDGLRRALDHRS